MFGSRVPFRDRILTGFPLRAPPSETSTGRLKCKAGLSLSVCPLLVDLFFLLCSMPRRDASAQYEPHSLKLVWLHAVARPDGERIGINRTHLRPPDVYTAFSRRQLHSIEASAVNGRFDHLTAASSPAEWQDACGYWHRKTVGFLLVRGNCSPDITYIMSPGQRALYLSLSSRSPVAPFPISMDGCLVVSSHDPI